MRRTGKPEAVVITSSIYQKASKIFEEYAAAIRWQECPDEEAAVAQRVTSEQCRIAVVGVTAYRGELYRALAANAHGGAALIARFGVGYDGIDLRQCLEQRIQLTITPNTLNQSVAEHTIGLMLCLARQIPGLERRFRDGSFEHRTGIELCGKSLGLAGFGGIGRKVAHIASSGFGMKVLAFDVVSLEDQTKRESLSEREFLSRYGLSLYTTDYAALASQADFLSIHMALTSQTRGFFHAGRLGLLREGAWLVNTSRGALVDEEALFDALASGKLGGAALDVFSREPYQPADPARDLRKLPNVVLTPHVASDTVEANQQMARSVVQNVRAFLEGRLQDLDQVK